MNPGYGDHFKKIKNVRRRDFQAISANKGIPDGEPSIGKTARRKQVHPRSVAALEALLKRKQRRSRKKTSVVRLLIGSSTCLFGMVIAGMGLIYSDEIQSWWQRVEFSVSVPAVATAGSPLSNREPGENPSSEGERAESSSVERPRNIDHLRSLRQRAEQLDHREREIQRLADELDTKRREVESSIAELQQIRDQISHVLRDRVESDNERIDNLVEFYSSMKPQQAARVFENLDEDLAVEILGRMRRQNAADIMNQLDSEKAKKLSEMYAGYSRR